MNKFEDFKKEIENIIGAEKKYDADGTISVLEASRRLSYINDEEKMKKINEYTIQYAKENNLTENEYNTLGNIIQNVIFETINL